MSNSLFCFICSSNWTFCWFNLVSNSSFCFICSSSNWTFCWFNLESNSLLCFICSSSNLTFCRFSLVSNSSFFFFCDATSCSLYLGIKFIAINSFFKCLHFNWYYSIYLKINPVIKANRNMRHKQAKIWRPNFPFRFTCSPLSVSYVKSCSLIISNVWVCVVFVGEELM